MAKEELLEFDGVVTEVLPDGKYRVRLDNDHYSRLQCRKDAQVSHPHRRRRYDLECGRISYKGSQ
jgi:hypothetical protein